MRAHPHRVAAIALAPVIGSLVVAGYAGALTGLPAQVAAGQPAVVTVASVGARPAATAPSAAAYTHVDGGTDTFTSYSSTGQGVLATQVSDGVFVFTFPGISFPGPAGAGNVQLTGPITQATPGATCSVQPWGPASATDPTLQVTVDCFDPAGNPAVPDPFDLLITQPLAKPAGVLDYAYVPPGPLSQVTGAFKSWQFNSSGKVNSVTHPSTGVYAVTMPGSGSAGNNQGTVKVSLTGSAPGSCQLGSWTATTTAQKITVRCFDQAGTLKDLPFTVAYARGNNLMGRGGLEDANATVLGGGPSPVYQPAVQFDSEKGARITAAHVDPGKYLVFLAGSVPTRTADGGLGHIQITPINAFDRHCGYDLRSTLTPKLTVTCTNAAGDPRDSSFTVQWVAAVQKPIQQTAGGGG